MLFSQPHPRNDDDGTEPHSAVMRLSPRVRLVPRAPFDAVPTGRDAADRQLLADAQYVLSFPSLASLL